MAHESIQHVWGRAPAYIREGGTMPTISLLEGLLRAPALQIPLGQHGDQVGGPLPSAGACLG
jgi:di- and tripeptidase